MSVPTSWVSVWLREGSTVRCVASDEPALAAALERLFPEPREFGGAGGEGSDTLLKLTAANGARIRLLASAMLGFMISTPRTRDAEDAIARMLASPTTTDPSHAPATVEVR